MNCSDLGKHRVLETSFHPYSHLDGRGRVAEWNGRIFRAIPEPYDTFYRDFIQSGIAQAMERHGLVRSDISSLSLQGYPLVIEHPKLPFWSVPTEWPFGMLRDASIFICDLNLELLQHGLATVDFCTRNVLFDGGRPIFIDFGSVAPATEVDPDVWLHDCFRYAINPLILMSVDDGRLMQYARCLMHHSMCQVNTTEVMDLLRSRELFRYLKLMARLKGVCRAMVVVKNLSAVMRIRKSPGLKPLSNLLKSRLSLPGRARTVVDVSVVERQVREAKAVLQEMSLGNDRSYWSEYYKYKHLPQDPCDEWTPKHWSVYRILQSLKPATVLDVGCNIGWFSKLSANNGSKVVAFDTDEVSVHNLYRAVRRGRLDILALVSDFAVPWGSTPRYPSMEERLPCEMVLAMALIHHLVFGRYMNPQHIIDKLAVMTKRWLLLEYVDKEDGAVKCGYPGAEVSVYSLSLVENSLRRHFATVQRYESYEHRTLLLAEK